MMIPAITGIFNIALHISGAAELAPPDDQGFLEQSALFEIEDERGARLIDILALQRQMLSELSVLIPAAMIELNETNAALDQPAREQTIGGKRSGFARIFAVKRECAGRLTPNIHQLRDARLHPVSHFVLGDARLDLRIADALKCGLVQSFQGVEHLAPGGVIESVR